MRLSYVAICLHHSREQSRRGGGSSVAKSIFRMRAGICQSWERSPKLCRNLCSCTAELIALKTSYKFCHFKFKYPKRRVLNSKYVLVQLRNYNIFMVIFAYNLFKFKEHFCSDQLVILFLKSERWNLLLWSLLIMSKSTPSASLLEITIPSIAIN